MLDNEGYSHTLRICNTYCLSSVTKITLSVIRTLSFFVLCNCHRSHTKLLTILLPLIPLKCLLAPNAAQTAELSLKMLKATGRGLVD